MPLPPALAAKLAKRGIIKEEVKEKPKEPVAAAVAEEVIAESYDDENASQLEIFDEEKIVSDGFIFDKVTRQEIPIFETPDCPNRINPYHICLGYCVKRYGLKPFESDDDLNKKRSRLLRKYTLPDSFVEVADPETGRFYYWNTENDEVSWLPPKHPKAKFTLPAEKLKDMLMMSGQTLPRAAAHREESQEKEEGRDRAGRAREERGRGGRGNRRRRSSDRDEGEESGSNESDLEPNSEEEEDFETLEKEILRRKLQSEKDRGIPAKKRKDPTLDPMDPASYSDIPKGSWKSGLEIQDQVKSGVDSTATGPLFQQRPYPSPGAVLRMNSDGKKPNTEAAE